MKATKSHLLILILSAGALLAASAGAQAPEPPAAAINSSGQPLTRFDLDFPGGTPQQLVAAITKASGKPLNAIVPTEYATWKIPPLKMTNVTTAELFSALDHAGGPKSNGIHTAFVAGTFRTRETQGRLSDTTVWYFNVQDMPRIRETRYFLLQPYLDRGLTVDDITTAIQTGWKMRGLEDSPALSFHRETKLLIAVGDPALLQSIDLVLKALGPQKPEVAPAAEKKS